MAKRKDLSKGYEKLHELAGKARVELEKMLSIIGKEADLSSKFLKNKISALGIDNEIEKKYRELGKEVYGLINEGKITETTVKKIGEEIDKLYDKLGKAKKEIDSLKGQMSKTLALK